MAIKLFINPYYTITVGINSIDGDYHMARPKKNIVRLSDSDVKRLKSIIYKKDSSQTTANRYRILLALDEVPPPCQTLDGKIPLLEKRSLIATVETLDEIAPDVLDHKLLLLQENFIPSSFIRIYPLRMKYGGD